MIAAGLWLALSLSGAGVYYLLCQRWIYSSGPMLHIFYCAVISLSLVIFILRDGLKTPLDELVEVKVKSKQSKPSITRPEIWRIIMKSKITKFATAAVFVAVAILSITFLDNVVTPAYGITDALNIYKNASTIHIHGWAYIPIKGESTQEFMKVPFEHWFDLETGCYKMTKPGGIDKESGKPKYFTIISDGQYVMKDFYTYPINAESYKSVRFERMSEFHSRLQSHNSAYNFLMQTFGGVDRINGFARVGDEIVKGIRCGIWKGEITTPGPKGGMQVKIKSWLSLDTGELTMVQMWQQQSRADKWKPVFEIDQIELDTDLPEDIFITEPPENSRLENTKDTAPWAELGATTSAGVDDLMLNVHVAFTLADGSVVICWRSTDKEQPSQDKLFSELEFGGVLPKLPIEIYALKAIGNIDAEYFGYHLAHTKKEDRYFEWSIYVPQNETPTRESIMGYQVVHRYNTNKEKVVGSITLSVSEDIQINTEEDFSTWVLGALKELSDDERLPNNINYKSIQHLVDALRRPTR